MRHFPVEHLQNLTGQLSADGRAIVELRHVQGLSYAQISQTLQIPMGTVMSRLSRARDSMGKLADGQADAGTSQDSF
jgi:RNA polymerase sigma-70 factor (ECF subfamily)